MVAVAFDTLKFAQTLRERGKMSAEQAEAISVAFAEATGQELTTKRDLNDLRSDLRVDIADLRSELKAEIAELRQDFNEFKIATHAEFTKVRSEIRETELRLNAKIEGVKADIIKWSFGFIVAQTGLIIAAIKLLH